MSSFLSGLRTALTRAASYGSAPESQEATAKDDVLSSTPFITSEATNSQSPVQNNTLQDEDSNTHIDLDESTSSTDSHAPSSRTLSLDDSTSPQPPPRPLDPSTPLIPSHPTSTPKTIFQTAQKDIFKSAFKSAAKERDIFMTAMPVRTWNPITATSPLIADNDANASPTALSHTPSHAPSVISKRGREDSTTLVLPKRRRPSQPPLEDATAPSQHITTLATTHLSESDVDDDDDDDDNSADVQPVAPSTIYFAKNPPSLLDRKSRQTRKRSQPRSKIASNIPSSRGVRKSVARASFKKSVSGREMMVAHARKRFWEGRGVHGAGRGVSCY